MADAKHTPGPWALDYGSPFMITRRIAEGLRRKATEYRKGDKPQRAEGCDEDADAIDALLLDYRERGRALEAASPVVPVGREEALSDEDFNWLERTLKNEISTSHCGESTSEAISRGRMGARVNRILAALSRSKACGQTEGGDWQRTDIQRLMHPVAEFLRSRDVTQRIAEEASERAVDAMYRALAAPTTSSENGDTGREEK